MFPFVSGKICSGVGGVGQSLGGGRASSPRPLQSFFHCPSPTPKRILPQTIRNACKAGYGLKDSVEWYWNGIYPCWFYSNSWHMKCSGTQPNSFCSIFCLAASSNNRQRTIHCFCHDIVENQFTPNIFHTLPGSIKLFFFLQDVVMTWYNSINGFSFTSFPCRLWFRWAIPTHLWRSFCALPLPLALGQ